MVILLGIQIAFRREARKVLPTVVRVARYGQIVVAWCTDEGQRRRWV